MAFTEPRPEPRHPRRGRRARLRPDGPGTGDILPHERTIPRHRTDRLSLLRATRANLDPIWGLSGASGLAAIVGDPDAAMRSPIDPDGVQHAAWPITDRARRARSATPVARARSCSPTATTGSRPRARTAPSGRPTTRRRRDHGARRGARRRRAVGRTDPSPHGRDRCRGTDWSHAFTIEPMGDNTPDGVVALERAMADDARSV
jgi:hypothetical protein